MSNSKIYSLESLTSGQLGWPRCLLILVLLFWSPWCAVAAVHPQTAEIPRPSHPGVPV